MRAPRRRLAGTVLACCTSIGACSTGSDTPFVTPNATMVDGLSVLPADDTTTGGTAITINDYARAAAAMDVEQPPTGATEGEARDWIVQLFGGRLDLRVPAFLGPDSLISPEVVEDEFGWSPYDIDVSAELLPVTDDDRSPTLAVLTGDLSWGPVVDLGGDVGSIGDGDDGTPYRDQRSELRPSGIPLRTGERDGQIAASVSTDLIREWTENDYDDAASDPALRSAAERLDAADAYTADLVRADFAATDGSGAIDEPFEVLAIGLSGEFDELQSTLVYVFADDDGAGRAVDQIDDAWNALDLSGVDGTFEIITVEQRDDAVVVVARVEDGRTSNLVRSTAADAGLLRHG